MSATMEANKKNRVKSGMEVKPPGIEVTLGPLPGYVSRRVDVYRMSVLQSETLAAILSGLQFNKATLLNGTPVKSPMHAIQWMLENVK